MAEKRVGVLVCGEPPDELGYAKLAYAGMFETLLSSAGFRSFTVRAYAAYQGEMPHRPGECDAWIVSGSRYSTLDEDDWIAAVRSFIRACFVQRSRTVGICFGHQLMGQAFGGKVARREEGWCVGRFRYLSSLGADGGRPSPRSILAYHQDQVVGLPPRAEILASSDRCRFAALGYGDAALGIQPHPEFEPAYFRALVTSRAGNGLPPDVAREGLENLDAPLDNPFLGTVVGSFLALKQTGSDGNDTGQT